MGEIKCRIFRNQVDVIALKCIYSLVTVAETSPRYPSIVFSHQRVCVCSSCPLIWVRRGLAIGRGGFRAPPSEPPTFIVFSPGMTHPPLSANMAVGCAPNPLFLSLHFLLLSLPPLPWGEFLISAKEKWPPLHTLNSAAVIHVGRIFWEKNKIKVWLLAD